MNLENNNNEFISLERKENSSQINLDKQKISGEDIKNFVNNSENVVDFSEFDDEIPKTKIRNPWFVAFWVVLGILGIIAYSMLMLNIFNTGGSSIKIADSDNNRTVLMTVEGNDKLYTSAGIYKENIESVVAIQTEIVTTNMFGQRVSGAAAGSGFVISEDGYILTNAHVVDGATSIKVTFENGEEYKATVAGKETENDVAVLKIDGNKTFNAVTLGNSDKMVVGEDVIAIGNPLGELTFSLTKGVVSALDREIMVDSLTSINMFQVDCAVNEGNSGGPIFNMYGEVVGIVSAKYASETIEGLGFCIPINDVANIVTDLIEHGEVKNKAYMGITVSDVTDTMVKQYSMVKGAYVSSVEKESCADKAGLKIGDIIVELDGKKVTSVSELMSAKRGFKSGESAKLKVWRSGDYVELKITFDEYDAEEIAELEKKMNEELVESTPKVPSNNFGDITDEEMLEEFFRYYFSR